MRIEWDHDSTKIRRWLFTFMALYSRRLWVHAFGNKKSTCTQKRRCWKNSRKYCTQLQQKLTKWAFHCHVKLSMNRALEWLFRYSVNIRVFLISLNAKIRKIFFFLSFWPFHLFSSISPFLETTKCALYLWNATCNSYPFYNEIWKVPRNTVP